jgi:PTH1 family peptidyl-tRNA hydrolase
LDFLASLNSLSFLPSKGDYYFAKGNLKGYDYQLIKPTTFVNNSGLAARQALETNNLGVKDLLIVHDDINLPNSEIRVKVKGGDGGHNGLNSVIWHLMSDDFIRLRIGIGNDFAQGEMAAYVLSDFTSDEMELIKKTYNNINNLINEFITGGVSGLLDANSRLSNPNKNSENNNLRT